jgi:hypothetical protein
MHRCVGMRERWRVSLSLSCDRRVAAALLSSSRPLAISDWLRPKARQRGCDGSCEAFSARLAAFQRSM